MKCPMCGGTVDAKYRPFCSDRCADLDLARWLNGSYSAPSQEPEDVEAALEAVEAGLERPPKPH